MEDFFQESETVMEEANKKKTLAEHWATLKGEFKKKSPGLTGIPLFARRPRLSLWLFQSAY